MTVKLSTQALTAASDGYTDQHAAVMADQRLTQTGKLERVGELKLATLPAAQSTVRELWGALMENDTRYELTGGKVFTAIEAASDGLRAARDAAQTAAIDTPLWELAGTQARRAVRKYGNNYDGLLAALQAGELSTQAGYWLEEHAEELLTTSGGGEWRVLAWLREAREARYNTPAVLAATARLAAAQADGLDALDATRRAAAIWGSVSDYMFYAPHGVIVVTAYSGKTIARGNARTASTHAPMRSLFLPVVYGTDGKFTYRGGM